MSVTNITCDSVRLVKDDNDNGDGNDDDDDHVDVGYDGDDDDEDDDDDENDDDSQVTLHRFIIFLDSYVILYLHMIWFGGGSLGA